ncbi:telomerase reverse transcriptase isoform X5 [Amborella trichopoda]|uniref:telomerase reverse transcriptase isoform X5 n=1 Tax=Amborella trichopoda TaxID=13333 RepID=UPI0005D37CAA|nr:telomerase reverse transcriptase isoform X5 [Amborella trichopoda]|eukprot:XP_011626936.1 telomerase reverse transcriptase isoform X5 [Amborella trichopoda]
MATSISLKPELATMKRKKRKRRVPEFMRRVYGDKYVNTLGNVILSMLPLQNGGTLGAHTGCRCKGRGCLGCSGDPMAFILRDGDPPDYRALISRSFAVLHLLPDLSLPFSPHVRWTQEQIVRRVIDMESCIPYSLQWISSSPMIDVFCSSAWSLLLTRIGDEFMFHLLRHTSIFSPLNNGNYIQIAGAPFTDFIRRFIRVFYIYMEIS